MDEVRYAARQHLEVTGPSGFSLDDREREKEHFGLSSIRVAQRSRGANRPQPSWSNPDRLPRPPQKKLRSGHPGGQLIGRPPSRCTCKWNTV